MIIRYITLENFRQFSGEHTIHFSSDPDKKATLIIAQNGTGKTTLLESFSWIFYGTCNLKSIVNSKLKETMRPYNDLKIRGEVGLTHLGKEYTIKRYTTMSKSNVQVKLDDSIFSIEMRETDGTLKEYRGTDARALINEIVPKGLFPYFFFKGESIERIGRDISEGKNSKNSEFVKAIKGMLGFDYLYQEKEDLLKVQKQYDNELASNNSDEELRRIQQKYNKAKEDISKYETELKQIGEDLKSFEAQKKEVSDEILKSGDVSEKQKESLRLAKEIKDIEDEIAEIKKDIFNKFSLQGYKLIAQSIIIDSIDMLQKHGDIDKGIPGLDAKAVEYMLSSGKCICGCDLKKNSEHYNALVELKKYLPPNNLGAEITAFNQIGRIYANGGDDYYSDLVSLRKKLHTKTEKYAEKVKALAEINEIIKNYPDMTKKKGREQELIGLINDRIKKQGIAETLLGQANDALKSAEKEKSNYSIVDSHIKKLEECDYQVTWLISRLSNFLNRKEREKRQELQEAINEIFLEIFDIDIKIELDNDYGIKLKSGQNTSLSDFENSTSQDAIMAFSFIGGIIKLARNKTVSSSGPSNSIDSETEDAELEVEPYPLVMDAPSSSFDIERIANFCKIMPSIAEQVIFFIKDTDGLYVKNNLRNVIGKEYVMNKISNSETEFEEVK